MNDNFERVDDTPGVQTDGTRNIDDVATPDDEALSDEDKTVADSFPASDPPSSY